MADAAVPASPRRRCWRGLVAMIQHIAFEVADAFRHITGLVQVKSPTIVLYAPAASVCAVDHGP